MGARNSSVRTSTAQLDSDDDEEEVFYDSLCDLEFDELMYAARQAEGLNLTFNAISSQSEGESQVEAGATNRAESQTAEVVIGVNLNPRLKDYKDCFYGWICSSAPFSIGEAKLIVDKEKVETDVDRRVTKYLQWRPLETVSNHLILAFCHLIMRNFPEAGREINLIVKLLRISGKDGYISQDHITGLAYVYYGLIALTESLLMESGPDKQWRALNFNQHIEYCISINESNFYGASTKAAIAFVKAAFFGARHFRDKQIAAAEEVVAVEKRNVEMWIYLYNAQRLDRKIGESYRGPHKTEKSALINAWNIHQHHPLVKLSISIYLSDKLRKLNFRLPRYGWNDLDGIAEFLTVDEVASYIVKNCQSLLEDSGMHESIRDNVSIGAIYMSGLPRGYQNYDVALDCLETAVLLNTNCSSGNHKLGILKMTMGKPFECAFSLVRHAFVIDPRNFSALIDCLQMLLSKVDSAEHREMTMTLLRDNLVEDKWSKVNLVALHMVKGFFFFMCGDKEAAMMIFKQAHTMDPERVEDILKKLPSPIRRYNWDERLISQQAILDHLDVEINFQIENNIRQKKTANELETFHLMRKYMIFALNKPTSYGHQNGRRGGYNNAGQRNVPSYRGGGTNSGGRGPRRNYDERSVSKVRDHQSLHRQSNNNSTKVGVTKVQQPGAHNMPQKALGNNGTIGRKAEPDKVHVGERRVQQPGAYDTSQKAFGNNVTVGKNGEPDKVIAGVPQGYPTLKAVIAACRKGRGRK